MLGERLFTPDLWKPTRRGLAGGLALGLFIGFTPTMGVQVLLSGLAAYFLRVNIPVALVCSLVTNPFTAAVIYPLQYQLGVWLIGVPTPEQMEGVSLAMRGFVRYARPLWAGSLFVSAVAAVIGYVAGVALWNFIERTREAKISGVASCSRPDPSLRRARPVRAKFPSHSPSHERRARGTNRGANQRPGHLRDHRGSRAHRPGQRHHHGHRDGFHPAHQRVAHHL